MRWSFLQSCIEKQPIVPDLVRLNPQLKINLVITATIIIKTKLAIKDSKALFLIQQFHCRKIKSKCSKNYNGILPIVTVQVPQIKAIGNTSPDTGRYTFNNWKMSAQYYILCEWKHSSHSNFYLAVYGILR